MTQVPFIMLVLAIVLLTATIFVIGIAVARELRNLRIAIEDATPAAPSLVSKITDALDRRAREAANRPPSSYLTDAEMGGDR